MKKNISQVCIASTVEFMKSFLGMNIKAKVSNYAKGSSSSGVSGIISITGDIQLSLIISFQNYQAWKTTLNFLGMADKGEEIDFDLVRDAIGEISNILAGHIKANLDNPKLQISLPQIIIGAEHSFQLVGSGIKTVQVEYLFQKGGFWQNIQYQNLI